MAISPDSFQERIVKKPIKLLSHKKKKKKKKPYKK